MNNCCRSFQILGNIMQLKITAQRKLVQKINLKMVETRNANAMQNREITQILPTQIIAFEIFLKRACSLACKLSSFFYKTKKKQTKNALRGMPVFGRECVSDRVVSVCLLRCGDGRSFAFVSLR